MPLDRQLAGAFIDGGADHRVLGCRLRPFCLWHRLLLEAIESPFLSAGSATLFDLQTAAGICQLRYPDARVRRPWWPIVCRQARLAREVHAFLAYLGDHLQRPEFCVVTRESSGPPPPARTSAPETLLVVADVVGFMKCPAAEAWEMPIGQAYWWQAMALRDRGAVLDFMDEDERDFQRQMQEAGVPPG